MKRFKLWGKADVKLTWDIREEIIEARTSDEAIEILLSRLSEFDADRNDECPRLNFEEVKEEANEG